ncbi:MAG: Coagulation factor 5/8 type domain-containing protein [Solirubrobacterales bacterium]|nr:Coagulation factor 5/8 type domain-containing protein [Solirubrobacterales bacterium]
MVALCARAALLVAGLAVLALGLPGPAAGAVDRFALANGCYALRSASAERFVVKSGAGWRAASASADAEGFRMQATALGRYLLMARDGSFLAAGEGLGTIARSGLAGVTAAPAASGEWRLDEASGDTFELTAVTDGRRLGVDAAGALTSGPSASPFEFVATDRCAAFPEAEVNVTGTPYRGPTSYGETKGLIETHLHGMAFEFLGGSVHCGRPWHPLGITVALLDCPDHGPGGQIAVLENTQASGNPAQGHNTDGWPSFTGWPHHRTYTHEQVYYKWLERAWRGGLRLWTNLLVDNEVLCEVYPFKRNPCNEMDNVRLQRTRIGELVEYIDAQNGGPGKGWLRIVRDPFEAREVINDGKLALVLGIETSKLFDCGEVNYKPQCDRATIDRQLEEVHAMGIRQMEVVNKLDNGLTGVAGDAGETGIAVNAANKQDTGHFWAMATCLGPTADSDHDEPQITNAPGGGRDELVGAILGRFLPPGAAPVYPPAPHCNQYGLTDLGAYLVRRMMQKKMLFDPDHMSVKARDQALSIIEAQDYGGVLSSHSWSTPDSYRRILRLGGVVTPAEKTVARFLAQWNDLKAYRNPRYLYGTGWSTDMNGFAAQGGPRPGNDKNPIAYPFRSLDGSTTVDRNRTGTRTWDLTKDGTAHFGLYPDLIEDVRNVGGGEVARDLLNGAEAYLQMWERAQGVRGPECRAAQRRFIPGGLGEIRIGTRAQRLLWTAGQPASRPGRVWTWCAAGKRGGTVKAVLTKGGRVDLVASTARLHRYASVGAGSRASLLSGRTRRLGSNLRIRRARSGTNRVVYGVRRGRVTFTAVVSRATASSPKRLRTALRLARLR